MVLLVDQVSFTSDPLSLCLSQHHGHVVQQTYFEMALALVQVRGPFNF